MAPEPCVGLRLVVEPEDWDAHVVETDEGPIPSRIGGWLPSAVGR